MAKSLDAKREELTNEIRDILKNAEEYLMKHLILLRRNIKVKR